MGTQSRAVLVTGASGFIGRHLVVRLSSLRAPVRAFVRHTSAKLPPLDAPIELAYGDIADPRAVAEAVKGCTHVVHLAAMTSGRGTDFGRFALVNVAGTQNVVDACRMHGVKRLVVVGTQSDNKGAYARTKREADEVVRRSGVPHVLLNPALVYGPEPSGLFGAMARAVKRLPVVPIVGHGRYPMRPVHVDDVCAAILAAMEATEPREQYYLSGSQEVTFQEFVRLLGRAQGREPRLIHVPAALVSAGLRAFELLRIPLPISSDTLKGLVKPRLYDSAEAENDLRFRPRPLEQGVRECLA